MRKRLLSWLTFAVPFFVALSFCGAAPGWLDSAEFVAASASLGLSHPPGHPAYLLVTHGFSFLPLGSIPFRMALFSALCLGFASWLAFRITLYVLVLMRKRTDLSWSDLCIPVLVIVPISLSYTCMLQAVRPEVYTFHALLMLACLERLLSAYSQRVGLVCSDEGTSALSPVPVSQTAQKIKASRLSVYERRDLLLSALWAGIALANHHYLTLLMLPGIGVLLWAWGWRSLWYSYVWVGALLLVGWGLLSYAYLPLRSVSQPVVHWGEAHSWRGWFWYVSAKAWQSSVRPLQQAQTSTQRIAALSSVFIEQLGWVWFFCLLFGCYMLPRLGKWLGVAVLLWWGMGLLGRWVFVVDRMDADLHGYLVVTMLFSGCMLALVLIWLWQQTLRLRDFLSEQFSSRLWISQLAFGAGMMSVFWLLMYPWLRLSESVNLPEQHPFSLVHCDRSEAWGSLVWTELTEEPLPLGAVLLSSHYQTGFLRWYREVVERHRPDLQNFPRNLMGHQGYTKLATKQMPEFKQALQAFSQHSPERIQAFRAIRPQDALCLEWFDDLPVSLTNQLSPSGSFFCWFPPSTQEPSSLDKTKKSDDESIQEQQKFFWQRVYQHLQPHRETDSDLRNVLLWTHYQHALFYEKTKRWRSASNEVERALHLFPFNKTLEMMKARIRKQLLHN